MIGTSSTLPQGGSNNCPLRAVVPIQTYRQKVGSILVNKMFIHLASMNKSSSV